MKLVYLLIMTSGLLSIAIADDFQELKAKKIETILKDPFANNKASCTSTTESGMKLKESWLFFKTEPNTFHRNLGGITKKGTYEVSEGVLKLQETTSFTGTKEMPSDKKWDYRYKLTNLGFEYIHEANGKKLLYNCLWLGTSLK